MEVRNHVCLSLVGVVVWEGQWHRVGVWEVAAGSAAVWPRVEARGQTRLAIWRVVGSCSISAQDRISISSLPGENGTHQDHLRLHTNQPNKDDRLFPPHSHVVPVVWSCSLWGI